MRKRGDILGWLRRNASAKKGASAGPVPRPRERPRDTGPADRVRAPVPEERIVVYTDGACAGNGRAGARAGVGVFFGAGDPRNLSEAVPPSMCQTNNVAEVLAIVRAVEVLRERIAGGAAVDLHSDSTYAIRCCGEYGRKLAANGWRVKRKGKGRVFPPNVELVRRAHELLRSCPSVRIHHVRAHTGGADAHSVGNDAADRLANLAIGAADGACPYADRRRRPRPSPRAAIATAAATAAAPSGSGDRTYLAVPYGQKEDCKAHGGRWDPKRRSWYAPPGLGRAALAALTSRWPTA
jgi:ribonuclease HI